jgi:outer membrane receptor for ferrienterochelin and colicin
MLTHRTRLLRIVGAAALALGLAAPVLAQAPSAPAGGGAGYGKIAGHVADRDRNSIAYADVRVPALKRGTMTDENGNFVLPGIPTGAVVVQVGAVGYDKITQTAQVTPGGTATLNFVLGEAKTVKVLEEMEIRGEKRIDTKSSSTKQSITAEKLKELPVDNLREAVATKAGVVAQGGELHFRGGRGDEVKIQFDGVEATDPLFGRGANIANLAIAGSEVITGGFDAEIGNALSGVINVSTKEGTDRLAGEVRWDTDRYGDPTKTFDDFDRFTFGFGGPTPIKGLTYFTTYEGTWTDTYLRSSVSKPKRTLYDFIQLGNRQFNQINTNVKLAYRVNKQHKVTFETIVNRTINTPYSHMWSRQGYVKVSYDTIRTVGQPDQYTPRYGTWSFTRVDSTFQPVNMPDHFPTLDDRYRGFTSVWTNQVSDKSVWTTRMASLRFNSLLSVGRKQPWEYWVQSPGYWYGNVQYGSEDNPYFATHGDYPQYFKRSSAIYTMKSDVSTRRWKQHSLKTGVELKYNRVENLSLTLPNLETNGLPGGNRSDFINFNPEGAAYVQDRWEFEGLVLNAGLRYDFFTPGDQISDIELRSGKRNKEQVSPRLGIAYPISDRDKLSFHYGWTYQTPAHNFIFENRGLGTSVGVRGNPDLEPETDIAYQAAMQHLFSKDLSGQFGVFFRDIYGLITARQVEEEGTGNLVSEYVNRDYASARGFEASLIKSFSHKFSAEINYTYSLATGVASDPNSALQFINGGRLYLPISERPLDWDQRHTVSFSGALREPGKWGLRLLWTYGSGFPFTPTFRNNRREDPRLENSRRQPSKSNLAIDGDKYYKVWGQNVTLFCDARNVLNVPNLGTISLNSYPNPYVDIAGDDYAIYYTETGRAGGAYLQDINGDSLLEWVPVHDPRVYEEGRNVRVGLSVTF